MKRPAATLLGCIAVLFLIAVAGVATIPTVPTGIWQPMGSMAGARSAAAAVVLQDHRVLITGGNNGTDAVNSAEVFNTDGSFALVSAMGTARSEHVAVVLLDGRALVAGGVTAGGGATNAAEIYDISSDTWTAIVGGMTEARSKATAALLEDGRVLIAGGQNGNAPSSTVEIFDPNTGQFSFAGSLSSPRMELASARLADGRVLITGGSNGSVPVATSDVFDPATNTVSAGPAMTSPRVGHSATSLLDGRVLIAGGNNGSADLASAEVFDPATGGFAAVSATLAAPRRDHSTILLPNNNAVLIVGGTSAGSDVATAETFTPWTGAFSSTGAPAVSRQQAAISGLDQDGLLLMAGGSSAGSAVSSAELYGFATVKTDKDDYAPGSMVTISGRGWRPGETVNLTLVESPLIDTHGPFTAVADSTGKIVNTDFVPDADDVGIRFYLVASGQLSGLQAQNTFTDAVRLQVSVFAITGPAGATDGTMNMSQPFTVQVSINNNSNGQDNPTWTNIAATLTTPSGWTKTADLTGAHLGNTTAGGTSTCTVTTASTTCTYTWTVTPPSSPSSGNLTVNVSGTPSAGSCSGGSATCSGSQSINGVSAVNPAVLSISSFTANQSAGDTILKAGESAAVRLVAQNIAASPGASALNVSPSALTVNATGTAGTTCGAGTPGSNNIQAGNTQNLNYTCGPVSGDGTLSFSGSASGSDQNSAAAISTETGTSNLITIDSTAPTATITSNPTNPTNNTSATFTFTGNDPIVGEVSSGVDHFLCKLDAVAFATCTSPKSFTGLAPGSHTFQVEAVDVAGNTGAAASFTWSIVLDNTAPTVTVTFASPVHGTNGWFNGQDTTPVLGTVTATDPSNVASITCTDSAGGLTQGALTGGGTSTASRSLSVSGDGTHNISCSATDGASNAGAAAGSTNTAALKIDTQAPTNVSGAANRPADHNGWFTSAVTINFSGTESLSGPAVCTSTIYSGPDNATASVSGHCTDQAGNVSADVPFSLKFDSTPPTAVALSVSAGTSGSNGWYTSDVTVHTSGTETVSGPAACTADQSQTAETTGQLFNGSCTNDAGLTANAASITIKLDKTGPTATLAVTSGTLGDNGWYTSDVTVHASGSDTISSPVSCSSDQTFSSETMGTLVNGSCTNDAGLSTNATALNIKLDKTAPVVALSVTAGTAGAHGWYTSDVTVHTSATDGISGVASCDGDQFQATETAGTPFNGSCKNGAGLTGNASPLTVKLDKTGPTATLAVSSGTLGDNGWYVSDVTVQTTGNDSISNPTTCTSDQTLNTDSTGTTFHGSCTNDAGLSIDAADLAVKLDKTPPVVTLSVTAGTAGTNGWYISDATVHTSGTDTTSGIATCDADQFQSTETTGVTFNGSCKNGAGLRGYASPLTVKLDKTGPTGVASSVTAGTAGLNGWYTSDVTTHTTGSETISTPVTCTADSVQGAETTGTDLHGSCTNDAGLTTQAPALIVKLDKTPPSATLAVTAGTTGTNGWYTSDVTVHASGTDSISSPVVCSPDQFQTAETAGTTFYGSCKNDAGLTANAASLVVKLDKTGPTAALTVTAGSLGNNGWYRSDVTIHTAGADSISNPTVCTADQMLTTDTAGLAFNGYCINDAGLKTDAAPLNAKRDATPPVINIMAPANNAVYLLNASAASNYNCTDATSGVANCTGPVLNGANFTTNPVAAHSFTVNATDQAGNPATLAYNYTVQYVTGGVCLGDLGHQILQPINADGSSVFNAKSTSPAKFRVCDANGVSIATPGVVASFRLVGILSGLGPNTVDEAVISTNPDNAFRWDPSAQQWIFNINNKSLGSANQTYYFQITLNDSSTMLFRYGLK